MGGACFSRISGAAGLNKNVPPNRRQFALVNHCKQMGAQMSLPSERSSETQTDRLSYFQSALLSFSQVIGRSSGSTRVSPVTVMKLVSLNQRGRMCMCT
jgi:hypothetical protein